MATVTHIAEQIERTDPAAAEELLPLVYEELKRLASAKMCTERADHTLSATALVHEAYLRLVDVQQLQRWDDLAHFFASAAEAMRRILVDRARIKASQKHGGGFQRVQLSESCLLQANGQTLDMIALSDALENLAIKDPRKAELVKLRFFAGLTSQQAAELLGIARSTADLDWAYAKTWLRIEMFGSKPG